KRRTAIAETVDFGGDERFAMHPGVNRTRTPEPRHLQSSCEQIQRKAPGYDHEGEIALAHPGEIELRIDFLLVPLDRTLVPNPARPGRRELVSHEVNLLLGVALHRTQ